MLDKLSGTVVKSYEIKEGIGQGGFGAVFRALQPAIGREVAIKIILPDYANQAEFIQRFEAEAQLVARLEHPHITPLYDYWRDPSGAYLVMRYLRGGSLRQTLERTGAWASNQVAQMLQQISSALAFAHINGVIHGDIKTDNILMDEFENAYLSDFGIAKSLNDVEQATGIQGTLASISPEQIRGSRASVQSDVYSLGIMVFESLTGIKPFFDDSTSAMLYKQLNEPLPPLSQFRPDLGEEINLVLQRASSKDASLRYDNVLAFAHAFNRSLNVDESLQVKSPSQEVAELSQAKNPYKGLRAFQVADADEFFGRESLVEKFLQRLSSRGENQNFLAVIGASGAGKSSVVKAGMLPRIREGVLDDTLTWYVAEMTPSSHPLEDLEAALLSIAMSPMPNLLEELRQDERGLVRVMKRLIPENSKLVLLIDQFEEIFTPNADEEERSHFLNTLYNAVEDERSHIKIIITLRADFYDRPLLYPQFGDLLRSSTELVVRLTEEELERAIVSPAERIGLSLESSVVTAIMNDVFRQPGALPLMQFALTELFERRKERVLSLEAYREIGGVAGAIAGRADELYQGFAPEEQKAVRQMFMRLVNLGDGTDDTRRRVYQAELLSIGSQEAMRKVLEQFGKYRLLTFDNEAQTRASTIELAHEALIRQWQRLREWLNSNREALRLHRRLNLGAEEWLQAGRDASFLAQGSRLEQFASLEGGEIALSQIEVDYLHASLQAYQAAQAAEKLRQARESALERQSAQRLRLLTGVMSIAAVISIVLAYFAVQAQNNAQVQANIAATEAAIASANEAHAVALGQEAQARLLVTQLSGILASDSSLAYAIGVELLTTFDNPPSPVVYTVADLFLNNFVVREFYGHRDAVSDVAYSPDGRTALTSTVSGHIYLWDVENASIIGELVAHTDWVPSVQFSPDGQRALSASRDGRVIIWDIASREPVLTFTGHNETFVRIAKFSPDGQQVLSGDEAGHVILWDANTGEEIRRMEAHTARVWDMAIAPNGRYAITTSSDKSAILWNFQTGEQLRVFPYEAEVISVAFAPDSEHFVLGVVDRQMLYWSVESEEALINYQPLGAVPWGLSISADGQSLVNIMDNGALEVWDMQNGIRQQTLQGHRGFGTGVAISPDGSRILSVSEDQSMFLWDLTAVKAHPHWIAPSNGRPVTTGAVTSDFQKIMVGHWDGNVSIWDVASQELLLNFTTVTDDVVDEVPNDQVRALAFAPNGTTLLTGNEQGHLQIWDAETGAALLDIQAHTAKITGIAYLPDAEQAITSSDDGTLRRWDLTSGTLLKEYTGHEGGVNSVALLPNGQEFMSASSDGNLILWNLETGEIIRSFIGHRRSVKAVAISPDGTQAISGSEDSRLILWDIAAGKIIHEFVGHQGSVEIVGFSPDGLHVVSGTNGGSIRIWDVETGEFLRRFDGRNWMVFVSYLPNAQNFISVAGDGSIEIWQAIRPIDELVNWIRANRYLTDLDCAEKLQYHLVMECED